MKNLEIYSIATKLENIFEGYEGYIPAKVNFQIQKNRTRFLQLKQDIEEVRKKIIMNYGETNEETGDITVPPEKIMLTNKELNDLLEIDQEVKINYIKINELEGLSFTPSQMEALMFMIKEE